MYKMVRRYVKRFRKGRKRSAKKVSWYDKKYSVGELAQKAMAGVWKLKGLVNSEMLKKDKQITGTVDSTGSVTHVTDIAQGDGEGTRTGNSIFCRALNWKGQVFRTTSGNALQSFRIMVVQDGQQITDSGPGVTDILESATVYSHLNKNTVGRFKVLYNRVFLMSSTGELGKNVNINIPMRHHVRYNGSATSDIAKGGLYVLLLSDQSSTNYPSIQSELRLSYHDN